MTSPTSSTKFPFPHPELTAIDGKPTAATLKLLRKEIYANASAVYSNLGGGEHGHLGAVMPAAAYATLPGTIAWIDPIHPGDQPVVVGLTAAQITATTRQYDTDLAAFKTFRDVSKRILSAKSLLAWRHVD